MVDVELLRARINAKGISITWLAGQLGITREAFYNKLSSKTEFKASEITKLKRILNLSQEEFAAIFFPN